MNPRVCIFTAAWKLTSNSTYLWLSLIQVGYKVARVKVTVPADSGIAVVINLQVQVESREPRSARQSRSNRDRFDATPVAVGVGIILIRAYGGLNSRPGPLRLHEDRSGPTCASSRLNRGCHEGISGVNMYRKHLNVFY